MFVSSKTPKKRQQFLESVPQNSYPWIKWRTWNFHTAPSYLIHRSWSKAPRLYYDTFALWNSDPAASRCQVNRMPQKQQLIRCPKERKKKEHSPVVLIIVTRRGIMQMLKSSHPKLADQLFFFKYILCSEVCQITSLASHSWARLPLEPDPDLKHFRHYWNETSGGTSQWDYAVIQLLIHTLVTQTSANQISTTCGEMWIFTLPLLEAT